jgi:hypothetical protein
VSLLIAAAQLNALMASLEARFGLEAQSIAQYRETLRNAQAALKKAAER